MKPERNCISGLDIQHDYLTVAQYAPDDHAVMLVAIQPITAERGTSPDESLGRELGALRNRFKFVDADINCSLRGEYAIIKKVPVDPEEKEIGTALTWELGQHIIGSVDEYFFDYEECGRSADGLQEYLIVAYRKEHVEHMTALLRRQKLTPCIVDLDLFALINVFEANYPEFKAQPAVLLHAEGEKAQLILTHHGKYIDHESIDYGAMADPQTFAELLNAEVERLCSFATLSGKGTGIPIFTAGSLFIQDGFLESVASVAGNVSLLHPFRKIGCRVGLDNDQLSAYLAQLCVAVGLALRGNE
ncbi:MAG: pilus assembly protein PilM [Chitinispirillaceae bacterium]|nr:pilus assembly protein PilM [Chitinispirillaceae bacterium]